jgi:hypothetical protein
VAERLRGETLNFDLAVGGKVIVEAGKRITARHVKQLEQAKIKTLEVPDEYLIGRILAHDVVDTEDRRTAGAGQRRDHDDHLAKFRKARHQRSAPSGSTTWIAARTSPTPCASIRPRRRWKRWSRSTA